MTAMDYSQAADWIIAENRFDDAKLGKCEAVMCLGNGYMGLRSATEESYLGEQRNLFVAGTFNKFDDDEVTELPNAADVIQLDMALDGQRFDLKTGCVEQYRRSLCLKTGELTRRVVWRSPAGGRYELRFCRVVSMERRHVIAQKLSVTRLDGEARISLSGGINGRMNNSGSQHFSEGEKRLYDGRIMQYTQTTGQSKIDFFLNTAFQFSLDGEPIQPKGFICMDRRVIRQEFELTIPAGQTLTAEKISNVYTSRDRECRAMTFRQIQEYSLVEEKSACAAGYDALARGSAQAWQQIWDAAPVMIESDDPFDQLAVRFAQYHLHSMTPAHDNRMNVAAKGLSGEAYKGHTFWDTEMFVLPYFIYSAPRIARSLEEYRWLGLAGAHRKAAENGYDGAQFPWEAAWIDDGEVTPVWGAADIVTGLPIKIWSGFIEQHITADVAYGAWEYYMVTGDEDFMDRYGYELILDTARFWASRLEEGADGLLHINDVVGPDEYKEHVDDNAFTNYMAAWNMAKAMEYAAFLKKEKPSLYEALDKKLGLAKAQRQWAEKLPRLYLPRPRADGVIPQDRTYLTLRDIDLTKYKNQTTVGSIYRDYNQEQITRIQVSKQADILIMFLLLEDQFSLDVKRANWNYYEPRTLHDSSLSLSTHCILASDMGDRALAYELFKRAAAIDLGSDMDSSSAGIHAAALGGIWQSVVFGFGGVRMLQGALRIEPHLPENWQRLAFSFYWHGRQLRLEVTQTQMRLTDLTGRGPVRFTSHGKEYVLDGELCLPL